MADSHSPPQHQPAELTEPGTKEFKDVPAHHDTTNIAGDEKLKRSPDENGRTVAPGTGGR